MSGDISSKIKQPIEREQVCQGTILSRSSISSISGCGDIGTPGSSPGD